MLKKQNRLKKRKEFGYIYKNGKHINSRNLSIVICKGYRKTPKVGFSVSTKIGKSVIRNRVKRLMRESVRHMMGKIETGYNYIIVVKPGIENCSLAEITFAITECLNKAGKLKNEA